MKIIFSILILGALICGCSSHSQKKGGNTQEDVLSYVDPYIGSDYHGHVFVGASVPFGGVQVGPTNFSQGWDWCSGYHYSDSIVRGFSQLHLSGTGIGDLGDVLVIPTVGDRKTEAGSVQDISNAYSSKYRHATESVTPGYYTVELEKYNIKVELTSTERVAFHRYTYPINKQSRVVLDLGEGIADQHGLDTYLKQINETTFQGYRYSKGWAKDQWEYFTLELNKPVSNFALYVDGKELNASEGQGEVVKGCFEFGTKENETVLMKIAISPVSIEGSMKNLKAELPGWDFDQTVSIAQDKWRKELSTITVKTDDEAKKRIFYTAMYHTKLSPNLFSDVDGTYRGADQKTYPNPGYDTYTVFSLWDTYRAANPLFTLSAPNRVDDMVQTILAISREQGKLPIWHLRGAETDCMVGYSAVPILVDAVFKGVQGIDGQQAYEAIKATITGDIEPGVKDMMELGYIPSDKHREAVAKALEYAISDWAAAELAQKLGKQSDYEYFSKRALGFEEYFDTETQFMRGKLANGKWRTPFNPIDSKHRNDDYCEGNAWQYLWLTPQNPEKLIELMGGEKAFTKRLDEFFTMSSYLGEEASSDITGMIGQYAHGNEPSHATAYLYAYAGEQYKSAEIVNQINTTLYTDQKDGIIGNEDCGQMSAWYIFSSMGFYPVNAANGNYVFGSPLHDEVNIALPNGKMFKVKTKNRSDKNIYIESATLNNAPYSKAYITHKDIMNGGELVFTMSDTPNKSFGSKTDDRPKSIMY